MKRENALKSKREGLEYQTYLLGVSKPLGLEVDDIADIHYHVPFALCLCGTCDTDVIYLRILELQTMCCRLIKLPEPQLSRQFQEPGTILREYTR
jgi:hypothetical protein